MTDKKREVCSLCRKQPCACKIITAPTHPDEEHVPLSVIHFPISDGRFVRIVTPLAPKTLDILLGVLQACKPALVAETKPDFEI